MQSIEYYSSSLQITPHGNLDKKIHIFVVKSKET